MNHIVAEGLLIPAGTSQVSQAVAMEDHNGLKVHVWLIQATGPLGGGNGLNLDVEGSVDLDNWIAPDFGFNVTVAEPAPINQWLPATGGEPAVSFPFIRVRYRNESTEDILLGASVTPYDRA